MIYTLATKEDIPQVYALQKKYHIDTIAEEDKADGFVTTLFSEEQFASLIDEGGLFIAVDNRKNISRCSCKREKRSAAACHDGRGDREGGKSREGAIVAYAMAASWAYWSAWPLFQFMIEELPDFTYKGTVMTTENSYQYGPVCIEKAYRGTGVLEGLFGYHLEVMAEHYPYMLTFINQINQRSFAAHTKKLQMDLIRNFDFNNQHYYELGYDLRDIARRVLGEG